MAVRKGRELTVKFETAKIGKILSASLNVDGNTIDISNDDSGDWEEFLAGRKNWTMSISVIADEEDVAQSDVISQLLTGDQKGIVDFGPDTPETDDVIYSGTALITNFTLDKSGSDERVESSFEVQGSGELTRSVTV